MTPEFPCADCGMNTCPLDGEREYYEVRDRLWDQVQAPGIGQTDNGTDGFFLCVLCLEGRLGRKLEFEDFKPFAANVPSPWLSNLLNDRLSGGCWPVIQKQSAQQFFPKALLDAVVDRYNPYWTYSNHAGATARGINQY